MAKFNPHTRIKLENIANLDCNILGVFHEGTKTAVLSMEKTINGPIDSRVLFDTVTKSTPTSNRAFGERLIKGKLPLKTSLEHVGHDIYYLKVETDHISVDSKDDLTKNDDILGYQLVLTDIAKALKKRGWGVLGREDIRKA